MVEASVENIGFFFEISPPLEHSPVPINFVSSFLGAGWVNNDPSPTSAGVPDENTRLLLAVGGEGGDIWKNVIYKLSHFGVPASEITAEHLLNAVKKLGMVGKYLVPVIQPKRVVMDNIHIIFVG